MSIFRESFLNEAILFLPPEGKKFKKEVNDKLKEMRGKIFSSDMIGSYKQSDINKVKNFLGTKCKKMMMSSMITVTTTSSNGVVTEQYYKSVLCSLNNGYMYFKCFFNYRGASAGSYNYIEKSKYIIPEACNILIQLLIVFESTPISFAIEA